MISLGAEIDSIEELLKQLRQPTAMGKQTFEDFIPDAMKIMHLENELDSVTFDALLIQAIIYCVFRKYDEPTEMNLGKAKKRDSYLLFFGLLDGYYHTNKDGIHYKASKRHKDYLANSDYIVLSYPDPKSSDNLDIDDSTSLPRGNLSAADTRCRGELERVLSRAKFCKKCLEKGVKKYVIKDESGERINLPKPQYTLDNFSNIKVLDKENFFSSHIERFNESNSTHPPIEDYEKAGNQKVVETSIPKMLRERKEKISLTLLFKIVCAVLIISIPTLTVCRARYLNVKSKAIEISLKDAEKIVPNKIEILNKNILLHPGEDDDLKIRTIPHMELSELYYYSTDDDIAKPEDLHSPHIIAAEDAIGEVKVIVHGAEESTAKDTATVIVRETDVQDFPLGNDGN